MDGQNEDQNSRRKFLKGAGLIGAAAVATPAAAMATTQQTELSPEQISKLEEIVKNFITNAQAKDAQSFGPTLAAMSGHSNVSHVNDNAAGGGRVPAAPKRD
jgi:hypothetical protein